MYFITVAQTSMDTLLQLNGAVMMAEQRYHLLKSKKYEVDAALKYVEVVKYSRIPTIDASYQVDLATANNITGMYYPGGVVPISGPQSAVNNFNPATGSVAGLLVNWQPITFGQREALINVSIAEANTKKADYQQALIQHKINVISSYLDLLLSYDIVKIHSRNIERVQASLKQSRVLASNGIKPGVDTALFLSELSKAKVNLINAQRQLQVNRIVLAQLIVTDALPVPTDTSFLNKLPFNNDLYEPPLTSNPVIHSAQSQFELSRSKELLLKKSYSPKLNIWGTTFARGSGFQPNGTINAINGLGLDRINYGLGAQLIFPVMKFGEVKKQLVQQTLLTKVAQEKVDDSKSIHNAQQRIAITTFNNNLAIVKETQEQLKSGQYAFNAMQVRYNTGMVNLADLIQAQYNLLQAELDSKKSYWDAWKALLFEASVKGDENIFLTEIK